jgi:hypothetical protein
MASLQERLSCVETKLLYVEKLIYIVLTGTGGNMVLQLLPM